ncbi:MAG: cobalamin biosynthesis protein CobQ, partial [Pseudomonadota bacterium]
RKPRAMRGEGPSMNTPAHLLIGIAACARRDAPGTGRAAALGSLLPDLSLYLMAGVSLFVLQIPAERVFGELYFSSDWQTVFAIDNSFIVWGLVLAAALSLRHTAAIAFATAGLLHLVTDFPLHNDDARPHFWPVSDWVFESPLSYWDSAHNAAAVAPFTLVAVLIASIVLWKRHSDWRLRGCVLLGCAAELWVMRQWLLFF